MGNHYVEHHLRFGGLSFEVSIMGTCGDALSM